MISVLGGFFQLNPNELCCIDGYYLYHYFIYYHYCCCFKLLLVAQTHMLRKMDINKILLKDLPWLQVIY